MNATTIGPTQPRQPDDGNGVKSDAAREVVGAGGRDDACWVAAAIPTW